MPFVDTSTNKNLPIFYNVVHAVGKECPNMRDDVMLVQYLLKAFYDKGAPAKGWQKPPGEMKVTGLCGPTTKSWIIHFQRDVYKEFPGAISLDTRVDRIRNKDLRGSITGTIYTLAWLNNGVAKYNPQAFVMTPVLIPMVANVPPPSIDIVREYEPLVVPATGGV